MNSIARHSTIFEVGDVVRVPFPFVERERLQARPALIVSTLVGGEQKLVWTLMITSARRGRWPGDIPIGPDHAACGLPVPCYVRTAKVAALEIGAIERRLGTLSEEVLAQVWNRLRAALPWL